MKYVYSILFQNRDTIQTKEATSLKKAIQAVKDFAEPYSDPIDAQIFIRNFRVPTMVKVGQNIGIDNPNQYAIFRYNVVKDVPNVHALP